MIDKLHNTLVPGAGMLAARMIERSGAELRLSSPVTAVLSRRMELSSPAPSAEKLRRAPPSSALPINALNAIQFDASTSCGTNAGDPSAVMAAGRSRCGSRRVAWRSGELATGGDRRLVLDVRRAPGGRPHDAHRLLRPCQSEFRSRRPAHHRRRAPRNFSLTPTSSPGTGMTGSPTSIRAEPGSRSLPTCSKMADPANWQAEGRMAFATSDIAPGHAGWFEGAIIAGEAAAKALLRQSNAL